MVGSRVGNAVVFLSTTGGANENGSNGCSCIILHRHGVLADDSRKVQADGKTMARH
jgi:hypothetical protein